MSPADPPPDDPVICFCNEIPLSEIVLALDNGAVTLADIFDATWAGCGPCGGSCQPDLVAIVNDYHGIEAEPRAEGVG